MKRGLALFDLDGTLTKKDSLMMFLLYANSPLKLSIGAVRLLPIMLLYMLGIVSNHYAKNRVFRIFLKGLELREFDKLCDKFVEKRLLKDVRPGALKAIANFRNKNFRILIISASPENYVIRLALKLNIEAIATKLEIKEGWLTGNIEGKNCYGEEKLNRLMNLVDIDQFEPIVAFGNSKGDRSLLKIADQAHYRPFRA